MNKNAIQKYAVWARNELISQIKQRAYLYGIDEKGYGNENADSVNGRVLSANEKSQRNAFISEIKKSGFQQAVEEVAYTWFNRFAALRYMEVNDYLPTHVRVFSDSTGAFSPEILKDVLHLDLDGLDKVKVAQLLNANATDELYCYLLLTQCNALNSALPEMFEKLGSYTEMLLPGNILKDDSILGRLVMDIPEEDWRDTVQIIGWLYQYYNTEPKQAVFDDLKKNVKITKEKIPAATQLFTPDWIVRYMVENSLGRLWLEGHPNDDLKSEWKYYLDEAEQTPEVTSQLDKIRTEYKGLNPEEIRIIDPCMGSGHILVYAFDVLMQIYRSAGYAERDAAKLILEKNLYGLDIDRRAYQLAYFSLMMKARQYNRRSFSSSILPNLSHTQNVANLTFVKSNATNDDISVLLDDFELSDHMGSLVIPGGYSTANLKEHMLNLGFQTKEQGSQVDIYNEEALSVVLEYIRRNNILVQKYDVVITNPPYMSSSNMNAQLLEFVKKFYPDSKSDLFAVFIERCLKLSKQTGYISMITQHSWMFLSSFEKLRSKLLKHEVINMAHLGARAFDEIGGEVVQTTAFVMAARKISAYRANYVRLVDYNSQSAKEMAFLSGQSRYTATADNFAKIPGSPVAYWVSEKLLMAFENDSIYKVAVTPSQNVTGDNGRFVRKHWELPSDKIGGKDSWIFYAKGGGYRKWVGNLDEVVDWTPASRHIYQFGDGKHASQIINKDYWYHKGITWGLITSNVPSFRVMPEGATFDKGGSTIIVDSDTYLYILGLLNSNVFLNIVKVFNPTLNFQIRDICNMPLIKHNKNEVDEIVSDTLFLSRNDWDSFETSWDFKQHPLVVFRHSVSKAEIDPNWSKMSYFLKEAYRAWEYNSQLNWETLKKNEEELNRIFIDIYGLHDELTPEVEDKDITVYRIYDTKDDAPESMKNSKYLFTKQEAIKSLISYAVGCMFGRYSLDVEGLAYAGGEWDASKYNSYIPDTDNVLPICDDEYFDDDLCGRFVDFIKVVYGEQTLEENLRFIANALGGSGLPREIIRKYFINDFYKDHCKIYQKRPIYWLFDSGKKNGFKALVYLHRYQSDLLAKLRTDYVHEQQERYRTQLKHIADALNIATGSERAKLLKQQDKLTAQAQEVAAFEEKVHHLADMNIEIDLDNGVKKNYELFADVLAKI